MPFFFTPSLSAQSNEIHWLNLSTGRIGYQLYHSDTIVAPHTQVLVTLHLETVGSENVIGAEFSLGLDTGVSLPAANVFNLPASSDLGSPEDLMVEYEYVPAPHQTNFSVFRSTPLSDACSGGILEVHLLTGPNPVLAEHILEAFGGGILILDNMDMKRGNMPAESLPVSTLIYPNPCTEGIQIETGTESAFRVSFFNGAGKRVYAAYSENRKRIELPMLSEGLYFLVISDLNGNRLGTHKLFKR